MIMPLAVCVIFIVKEKTLFFCFDLDWPLLAFAGLYLPLLTFIEFFDQKEILLVKKCIKTDHFYYSNIKNNFQTKF